jgi:hypothetical protein
LSAFYICLIIPYYYKKIEHQKNCIMKTKGPFVKVISLNEAIKHPLIQPNLDIGRLFYTI